jgi:putative transposase
MHFEPNKFYHLYNLGINDQPIFHSREHYQFFLKKISIEWLPYTTLLAYCLLPTQFHIIVTPNEYGCENLLIQRQFSPLQQFSRTIGSTLSSYTKAVNKQINRRGGLFHKKTFQSELSFSSQSKVDYKDLIFRINLLHRKPVTHSLCKSPLEWEFCSAREYHYEFYPGICASHLIRELNVSLKNYKPK